MTTKPEVLSRIEATFSQLTPSEKRVASWMLAHVGQIPFETAESVALATVTSGITVGRFLRKLGYRNLDDAKKSLRDPHQPWGINERLDSWKQQQPLSDRLQNSLSLEVDAIAHVYQLARSGRWSSNLPMPTPFSCWGSSPRAGSPMRSSAIWSICARG